MNDKPYQISFSKPELEPTLKQLIQEEIETAIVEHERRNMKVGWVFAAVWLSSILLIRFL
ncbi:hypothetical protein ACQ4M3_09730 [Leptolyngbya sp. AN03gr2]|uniref:hypothetical protein n=1 Tax=Leptolyngbya sp. AN03gr2 TaxID=3423364 RepID=UPI003D31E8E9